MDKQEWLVKDAAGEVMTVTAHTWECGGNGLKFYVDHKIVAYFVGWQWFRKKQV